MVWSSAEVVTTLAFALKQLVKWNMRFMLFSGCEIYLTMKKIGMGERRRGGSTFFQRKASREKLEADLSLPLKVRKCS